MKVLSPESHSSEFTCVICSDLPPLRFACVTNCNHVYCQSCMEQWMARGQARCPVCNHDNVQIRLLSEANPLAFRVMKRIQVACPLPNCEWTGDYDALEPHELSSSTHQNQNLVDVVMTLKQQGNEAFSQARYAFAIGCYNKALTMLFDAPATTTAFVTRDISSQLLANRAAAFLSTNQPTSAAKDCRQAIEMFQSQDPKVFVRYSRALTEMGDFDNAVTCLVTLAPQHLQNVLFPYVRKAENNLVAYRSLNKDLASSNFGSCKAHLATLLQDTNAAKSGPVLALTAVVESVSGNRELADRVSLEALRRYDKNEWAWNARARVLMSAGELDGARRAARQAVTLNPDDEASKATLRAVKVLDTNLAGARQAADNKTYDISKTLFTTCLELIPEHSVLYPQILAERAEVDFKSGNYMEALQDSSRAIFLQDDTRKAWIVRFWCWNRLGRFAEAVNAGKDLLNRWGGNDHVMKSMVTQAEFELRKSQRPDLYAMLGVGSLASEPEIKQAYKQQALLFHPDKQPVNASAEEKAKAETAFKLLGTALEVLGNADKRKLWDEGYDVQGLEEELNRRNHHRR